MTSLNAQTFEKLRPRSKSFFNIGLKTEYMQLRDEDKSLALRSYLRHLLLNNLFEESAKFILLNNLAIKEKASLFALEFMSMFDDTNKARLIGLLQQNIDLIRTSSIKSYKDG